MTGRRFLPVKAAALAAAGILLTGGVAVAAPDSNSDKGGGKPSSAASGNGGSNPGKSGSAPGKSGSTPGNSGSTPGKAGTAGKPATTPGGNSPGSSNGGSSNGGQKNLPDTASPVAGAATSKANPAATGSPNSFGKEVSAAASQKEQIGATDVETPSATSLPTAAPAAVTVPTAATANAATTSTPNRGDDPAPAVAHNDHRDRTPEPHTETPPAADPQQKQSVPADPATAIPAAAAAALTVAPPQSAGETPGTSPATETVGSWLGRVAGHVADEVREALREVTLEELALAALPGLLGILFFFTTGIGLGHRQAKFGFALESTGALRFAIRGPIGVVRPGGLISIPARAGKRRSSAAMLDRAA